MACGPNAHTRLDVTHRDLVGRRGWLDPLTIRRSSSLSHCGRDTRACHSQSSLFWLLEEAAAGRQVCSCNVPPCDVGLADFDRFIARRRAARSAN